MPVVSVPTCLKADAEELTEAVMTTQPPPHAAASQSPNSTHHGPALSAGAPASRLQALLRHSDSDGDATCVMGQYLL